MLHELFFNIVLLFLFIGLEMVAAIDKGNATWSDLFTPFPFFANFKHFVALETSAASSADLAQWSGMIESRTRHLVRALLDNESLDSLTIWPNAVEKDLSKTWWIGFSVKRPTPGESVNINLQAEFGKFVTKGRFDYDSLFSSHILNLRPVVRPVVLILIFYFSHFSL